MHGGQRTTCEESGLFPPCGFQEEFSHGACGQVLYWLRHLTDPHSPPAMYIFKHFFVAKNYIAYTNIFWQTKTTIKFHPQHYFF